MKKRDFKDEVPTIQIVDKKGAEALEEYRKVYLVSEPSYKHECLQ